MRAAALAALILSASLAGPARAAGIQIATGADAVDVTNGDARFSISTKTFDVVHAASWRGAARLGPGRVTVNALGSTSTFGPPSEVTTGGDWVELRGWADAGKHLWYVARYQFFDGKPYTRLVLTLTDRHDTSPAEVQSARYWQGRKLAEWRLEVGAPGGKPASVTQHNSYSFSRPGEPWIEVIDAGGAPYQWAPGDAPPDPKRVELVHAPTANGANQIEWHPMIDGTAELTALVTPWTGGSAYKAAKAVTFEIVDAAGKSHKLTVDQNNASAKLGSFALAKSSVVRLEATGSGNDTPLAQSLRVAPAGGRAFEIALGARHDGVLADGPLTIAVKDFWQHHPMTLFRTASTVGWQAIERPEEYTGGMGLTLETLIALDGPPAAAVATLYAPPARNVPLKLHPVDGTLAEGPIGTRYDALLRLFASRYGEYLERLDSFGWRNWGDYQIGSSYTDSAGNTVEDWANLQYDLPNGLLVAWLRTGDPQLWRWAQASVRHLMDLDLVKFNPFLDKINGLVYRKGEMRRSRSHIDAEPITDQGFAFRSLLLYWQLTGETWARDLAKQNIDRLVFYAVTRPQFVYNGGRPTAWMLRAALAGAEFFPKDREHQYQLVADGIVRQLVDYYREHKRLPGRQPVWQAQMVEGLGEYQRRTGRTDVVDVIVGETRHLLTDAVRRRPDGGFDFMYCYVDGPDCQQWTNEDNYAFLWLSSIGCAYNLSHDPFFAKWGEQLFTFGEAKMREHHDTRPWTSALSFPFWFLDVMARR